MLMLDKFYAALAVVASRASGEGVEQDSEREREDALGDAEGESGWDAREVAFKVHLLF